MTDQPIFDPTNWGLSLANHVAYFDDGAVELRLITFAELGFPDSIGAQAHPRVTPFALSGTDLDYRGQLDQTFDDESGMQSLTDFLKPLLERLTDVDLEAIVVFHIDGEPQWRLTGLAAQFHIDAERLLKEVGLT